MASLVPLPPFAPASESWDSYLARFDCYLQANELTAVSKDRKRGLFLSLCGPEVFETARALVAPEAVQATPWDTIQEKLRNHYAPKPSKIAARHAFYHRNQAEGESINNYTTALRQAAMHCEFRDLDDALMDRIVCGVRDIHLQRRLLAKPDLTLQKAIEEAVASEAAERSAQEIRKSSSPRLAREPVPVHHEEASSDEASSSEDDDVHQTKRERRKFQQKSKGQPECAGCGGNHSRAKCRFRDAICRKCSRRGHIAKVCRSALSDTPPSSTRKSKSSLQSAKESCFALTNCRCPSGTTIGQTDSPTRRKLNVTVLIEGAPCDMEIDTGSALSIVSWSTIKRLVPRVSKRQLDSHRVHLRDYQGNDIPVVGVGRFRIAFKDFSGLLRLVVVEGQRPSLLGLDWFDALGLEVTGINCISNAETEGLVKDFAEVFDGTLGQYTGTPISFSLDPQVAPIKLKPRRVPFALKAKVDEQLDKLIAQGVLEPVDHAKWETPIVTPVKPDGSVRICADYKCTINKALQQHAYPVPVVQHLLHSLGEGKVFAKLDLAQAYQQLPVDDATAEAQTIVTHRGAFRCRRLQFGVSVAPGIFQSLMERLLQGLPGVVPYFDDVLVSADSHQQLFERLRAVLTRFQEAGLKVKREKCQIAVPQVEFLGYLIDASGLHPTTSKIRAIQQAPTPKNKTELQAFLGLLNFYNMFLPHKATVAEPLHRLLSTKTPWAWGHRETAAFNAVKALLSSDSVLVQYSESRPLVLACDASPFGIGAVLSHRFPDGREAPLAYFSRTLSPMERNYSQLDKEALALVAGVKRFHEYLYGRTFDLITDHKPLLGLLAGDRPTPPVLSPRMLRWTVFLAAYHYRLIHRPGKSMGHADALSRCPLPAFVEDPAPASSLLLIEDLPAAPVSAATVASASAQDRTISRVLNWVWRGWPQGPFASEFQPFATRQHELSAHRGCLLWGDRVVIPQGLRQRVLEALHVGHPGIVKMKALARCYVWWPNMDDAITAWVSACQACQESRPAPPAAKGHTWETPKTPWSRVHIDLAGPFHGRTFMVVVDAYSKWLEVALMPSTTTEAVIRVLRGLFATHGCPDVLVSDNGPQFTSGTFERYLLGLGIRHALTAPFHPSSNGQAERMVRSTKEALARLDRGDWHERVAEYLFVQHITPHAATGRSPAELLMGRRLRSPLDRLHPDFAVAEPPGCANAPRSFVPGNQVFARNYVGDIPWVPATVVGVTGPRSYQVALEDGRLWRRHIDQLRRRVGDLDTTEVPPTALAAPEETRTDGEAPPTPPSQTASVEPNQAVSEQTQTTPLAEAPPTAADPGELVPTPPRVAPQPQRELCGPPDLATSPRRSGRVSKRPTYLKDYVVGQVSLLV
uniref:Gypsy retrotransposon integrase-like protein 1 n=1 Tax=Podarcis muralis TaxID=64176 RepID=A0A670I4V1_PODMU